MKTEKLKLANGASEKSNAVKNVEVSFEDFCKRARQFPVSPGERSYILCGQVPGGVRGSKHGQPIQRTSCLMLDFDSEGDSDVTFFDFVDSLELSLGLTLAAYTTRSYNGNNVRFRAIIPFARELEASKHSSAVDYIAQRLPNALTQYLDGCSFSAEQPVFLPCLSAEGAPHHAEVLDGELFDPAGLVLESDGRSVVDDDDLMALVVAQPLDLTEAEIDAYLSALDPNTMSYGLDDGTFGWGNVIAALHHQYSGSAVGKAKAVAWSSRNAEKHNPRTVASKWDSFSAAPRGKKPVTFNSIISHAREAGGLAAPKQVGGELVISEAFDALLEEASMVGGLAEHKAFVSRVAAIPDTLLSKSDRSMIASELLRAEWMAEGGKGITLADIKSELAPKKRGQKGAALAKLPAWAEGWCYIEQANRFHLIGSRYEVNKEAFDARFNRSAECQQAEVNASSLLLNKCGLPTYADTLYMPGQAQVFDLNGQQYVNLFDAGGIVQPAEPDAQGLATIAKIERHFELLISDEGERRILLDWLAWQYQNPGQRCTWAVFLQGAEGIGKSFIQVMMAALMGRNVRVLEASTLAGRFTGWAHGATLIVVEEVRVAGESKYVVEDRMKPLIANDTIQIEEKGRDHREVPNFANYLLLSNHKDALPLQVGNRRYAVIFSDLQSEADLIGALGGQDAAADYFEGLFDDMRRDIGAVAHWLGNWHISDSFRHKGRAPKTKSFAEACRLSENHQNSYLEDMILKHACAVVGAELVDTMQLATLMAAAGDDEIRTQAVSKGMLELGYTRAKDRVFIKSTGRRTRVWFKPRILSEDKAREIVSDFYSKPATDTTADYSDVPF